MTKRAEGHERSEVTSSERTPTYLNVGGWITALPTGRL